jgi:hypothetical protein
MRLPPPDFVVVGAPKCGTTAIHETLQQHPRLFLSGIKEPHYFAYDYPRRREVEAIEDYDHLFAGAQGAQLRGEASAHYLSSKEATAAILQRRPDAKFKNLDEDEQDPERAWNLQQDRAHGLRIPKLCKEPAFLQYKSVCSLGAQIQALFRLVREHQRLVIVFNDVEQRPRQAYKQIVEFLDIDDDGGDNFVRQNVFARPRSALVARLVRFAHLNPRIKKLRIWLKPILNEHGIRPIAWLIEGNLRNTAKPDVSTGFRLELEAAFAPDVQLLSRLLARNLCALWSIGDGAAYAETGTQTSSLRAPAPCD